MATRILDENLISKRRKLSLDIEYGTKSVDLRPAVWTSPTHQTSLREVKVDFRLNGAISTEDKKETKKKRKSEKDQGDTEVEPALTFRERYLSWRYAMVFMFQASFVVGVFLKNKMPVALVCMVRPPSSTSSPLSQLLANRSSDSSSSLGQATPADFMLVPGVTTPEMMSNITDEDPPTPTYEFDWDGNIQSMLLTTTILFNFSGPLVVSALQSHISSKRLLTLGTIGAAVLTLLCPTAARISPYCLAAFRMVLGVLFGFNVPVVGDSLAWWAPQGEKLAMVSLTFAGIHVGGVFTSLISGFLCSIPIDNGWPFIFYVFGGLHLLWGVAWHVLSSQKPEDHPFISDKEKTFIIAHRASMEETELKRKEKPPYLTILRSVPVIAFLVPGCCQGWVNTTLMSYLPMFYVEILGFSVQEAGILISVLVLSRMAGAVVFTFVGNCLSARFSTRFSRKVCMVTGSFTAGFSLIGMSFFDSRNRWVSFVLLLVSSTAQSCGLSTLTAVPLDIAPRYSGLLSGMMISTASLVAVTGPPLVSALTPTGTHSEWQVVLIIVGAVNVFGGVVFGALGSTTLQPWARVTRESMPEIVSPFVTMGRRVSTFMDRPPIATVSSVPMHAMGDSGNGDSNTDDRLNFNLSVRAPTSSHTRNSVHQDLGLGGSSREVKWSNVIPGNAHRAELGPGGAGQTAGLDDESYKEDEDFSGTESSEASRDIEENSGVINDIDSSKKQRKRAFSEFGLEVSKLSLHFLKSTDQKMEELCFDGDNVETEEGRTSAATQRSAQHSKSAQNLMPARVNDYCEKEKEEENLGGSPLNGVSTIHKVEVGTISIPGAISLSAASKHREVAAQNQCHFISVRF